MDSKQLGSPAAAKQEADVLAVDTIDQSPFSLQCEADAASPVSQQTAAGAQPQQQHRPTGIELFTRKLKALFTCSCTQPPSNSVRFDTQQSHMSDAGPRGMWQRKDSARRRGLTPKGSLAQHNSLLSVYTDAEWFDARSQFSGMVSGMVSVPSDPAARLQEVSQMVQELAPAPSGRGPWIPDPPLIFAQPGLQFVPVPAHTGFAAYWERDPERSTPYPCPADIMIKASAIAQKAHASIPGMWLQETATGFTVTVKPGFMPPGLPRYTETYDKTMATEPMWRMRRDLRPGSTSGQIFMTTEGMLVLRARSRPMFGKHDYVMEEYLRLEQEGQVVVDRQCIMDLKTGEKATQYLVGRRHEVPLPGHV